MTTFTIDTNAGPIYEHKAESVEAMREYVVSMIPLLRKRGYTHSWETSSTSGVEWHVVSCFNSKGRRVHAAGFREGTLR